MRAKISVLFTLTLTVCLYLSGCNNENNSEIKSVNSAVKDPFDEDVSSENVIESGNLNQPSSQTESGGSATDGFSVKITALGDGSVEVDGSNIEALRDVSAYAAEFDVNEENWSCENGTVKTNVTIKGFSSTHKSSVTGDDGKTSANEYIGATDVNIEMKCYADGILQNFSLNGEAAANRKVLKINGEGETNIPFELDAKFDENSSSHNVSVFSFDTPNAVPKSGNKSYSPLIQSAQFCSRGVSQSGLNYAENVKIIQAEVPVLPDDKNIIGGLEANGDGLNNGELKLNLTKYDPYSEAGAEHKFRVSFYVNNEFTKFNGDCDYLDLTEIGGKMTRQEITISGLNAGDILYAVIVPLDGGNGLKTDPVFVW